LEKLELLNSMLAEESHRSYAIRVLEGLVPFIDKRGDDLTMPERTAFTFWMSKVIQTLEGLSPDYRARAASDVTKEKLEVAKQQLILKTGRGAGTA
jgi:hypothetical protein